MSKTDLNEIINSVVEEVSEWQKLTSQTPKNWQQIQQAIKTFKSNKRAQWYEVPEENQFQYHLDVPGFTKEELSIVYEDKIRSIVITGNKTMTIGKESLVRNVNQTLILPDEAQTEVFATLENGVLILSVSKQVHLKKVITIA